MRAAGLAMAVFGCAACGDAEKAGGDDSASAVRCCRVDDAEELRDFEQAIFSETGFCIAGRKDEAGYTLALGHVDSLDRSVIVQCDARNRPREIFADGVLITLNGATDDGAYVDVWAETEQTYGFYCRTDGAALRRAADRTIGDQVADAASFGLSLQALKEYSEVFFSPARNYLKPEYAAVYSKAGKALAAPGTVFAAIGLASAVVDMPRWVENLTNGGALAADIAFWAKFGGGAISSPLTMFIGSYLGLYTRYRELYEEHIEALYGACRAITGGADVSGTTATLSAQIEGYEPEYDLECGVSVASVADSPLREVTGDGDFSRTVEELEPGKTYRYRAFVISKTRMSLWAGVLGDLAGPLIRYGAWKKFTVPQEVSIVGKWLLEEEHGIDLTPGESYGHTWEMEPGSIMYLIFNENSTGTERYEYPGFPEETQEETFSYVLNGNLLQIRYKDDYYENEAVWSIEKLTDKNLQRYGHLKNRGEEWVLRQTFKRLK